MAVLGRSIIEAHDDVVRLSTFSGGENCSNFRMETGEVLVGFMPRARGTISVMWLSGPKTRMGMLRDSPDEKGSEFWGYYQTNGSIHTK